MATPHDDLFQFTLQHASHAGAWLASVLPPVIAGAIDWPSLVRAPEKLRQLSLHVADCLFGARRTESRRWLWLLAEHKSYADPGLETQLLRYVIQLGAMAPSDGAEPPFDVVPVVLYHGDAPLADAVRSTSAATPVDAALRQLQPRIAWFVDDLGAQSESGLRERGLSPLATLTLLCLKCLRGLPDDDVLAAFDRWQDLLRAADRDPGPPVGVEAVVALQWYALHVTEVASNTLQMTMERILRRPEGSFTSTADKLRQEGRNEGRVAVLLRQLERRFGLLPVGIRDRLLTASIAELDQLAERVLDASSLGELFPEA